MSNLAIHALYETLNNFDEVVCERAFFEKKGDILSVETKRKLNSFEILFFSISYELNYINIVSILKDSGISLRRKERKEDEPIIVGGGITIIANPEPVSDFFDLFILGDVEATIVEFMDLYLKVRGKKRKTIIEELSSFPWVYNPSSLDVKYAKDGTIDSFTPHGFRIQVKYHRGVDLAHSAIVSDSTEFAEMYMIEGTRGCPSRCRFCLMGNVYRFRADKNVALLASKQKFKDIGIIGGGLSFLPDLSSMISQLKAQGKKVHLPSLRIDKVAKDVIENIKDDVKTLTFGLEAGSYSLRKALGKPLSDEEILKRVEEILEIGNFNLKLYFMIGLPGEKKEDIEAIFDLVKRVKHTMVKKMAPKKSISKLTVHISPFVPKAKTPLQWAEMETVDSLEEKIRWLKKKLGKLGGTFFTHESVKYSFIQGVFARGDRRVNSIITRLAEGESLRKIIVESAINPLFYTSRRRKKEEIFPWDFIDTGQPKEELYKEYELYFEMLKET
ncbi:MAG: radical SAM protein [Desulfobacterota bacterium]|nr:radical SAM protein [Thermodesulfobacteriota bacterium]